MQDEMRKIYTEILDNTITALAEAHEEIDELTEVIEQMRFHIDRLEEEAEYVPAQCPN